MTNEIQLPGAAKDALQWADAIFNWITTSPIEIVGVPVIIILGYVLKFVPGFPSKAIPLSLFIISVSFYTLALNPSRAPNAHINPQVFMSMMGVFVWAVAWGFHAWVLKRWGDSKYLATNSDGNTVFMKRPTSTNEKGP